LSAALAGAAAGFLLPDPWGTFSLIAMVVFTGSIAYALMRRTPWCSDRAFWRTRPVSPGTLWLARSAALLVLIVLPAMVVPWALLAGLGGATRWLGLGLFGGFTLLLTGAMAAMLAIGSKGRDWLATAILLGFVPFIVVCALLARFGEHTPFEWQRLVSVQLVTLPVVAALFWLAWLWVGHAFRWKHALVMVGVTSALWPVMVMRTDRWFYESSIQFIRRTPVTKAYALEFADDGMLRAPLRVVGLPEGEFVVPALLEMDGERLPRGYRAYDEWVGGSFGRPLAADEPGRVFSNEHRYFAGRVHLEHLWNLLRERIPKHQTWVESDPAHDSTFVTSPDRFYFEDPKLKVLLLGDAYRFHDIKPIGKIRPQRITDAPGRLALMSASVPRSSAIDVRFRWARPRADGAMVDMYLDATEPPELWGILFHPSSGTAYGTASLRETRPNPGPYSFLICKNLLVLRFELPQLETALLGLDANRLLEESTLYLFAVEWVGPVRARLKPGPSQ
jgi:hypothetical protein